MRIHKTKCAHTHTCTKHTLDECSRYFRLKQNRRKIQMPSTAPQFQITNGKFYFPPIYRLPFSIGLPSANDYLLFHIIASAGIALYCELIMMRTCVLGFFPHCIAPTGWLVLSTVGGEGELLKIQTLHPTKWYCSPNIFRIERYMRSRKIVWHFDLCSYHSIALQSKWRAKKFVFFLPCVERNKKVNNNRQRQRQQQ